jgi:hypothetical protein
MWQLALPYRLHRQWVGCVDIVLCELRHRHHGHVSLGIGCKQCWCSMSGSHGDTELQHVRLPHRLFDGRLASLELLLSYVWDPLSGKDSSHRCSGHKRRQRVLKHDRR